MSDALIYAQVRDELLADDVPTQPPGPITEPIPIVEENPMPTTVEVLTAGGILRAADVVAIAGQARLDVASAAVLLVKESAGGKNIWGHDGVATGGAYTKGGAVTQQNYAAYKAAVAGGRGGRPGGGPTQLTYGPFQDQADARGGCWRWEVNVAVGFELLAGLIRQYGEQQGFRRYNGSGPAAEAYGRDAVAKLVGWRGRLVGAATPGSADGATPPSLAEGDTGARVAEFQRWAVRTFPSYAKIDLGPERYGPQTVAFVKEFQRRTGVTGPDANGTIVGPRTWREVLKFPYP